jgi:hypothetical protein
VKIEIKEKLKIDLGYDTIIIRVFDHLKTLIAEEEECSF